MAIQLPPAPPVQQAVPPTAPPKSGCFGRGCGCGCGSCLLIAVLIALLVAGGGYWFFVVQASAAVNASASLVVFNQPVTVDGNPAIPGQALNADNTVSTQAGGHAAIQFPDGSVVRMLPSTTVTLTALQLQKNGNLQSAGVLQKVGRTFTDVQHLVGGASFQVGGHSVSAQVRGTQFEVLVRPDGTNRIWVFVGTVTVSGTTRVRLTAGQEIDADANGRLSNQRSNQFDAQDPFPMTSECANAASSGTTTGTLQTSTGDSLVNGQSAESDYYSPGGNLMLVFCYPGSLMKVVVTAPDGKLYSREGPPPIKVPIPNGPPGLYRAVVTALSVAAGGEAYSIAFATDAQCTPGNVDNGTTVRETLSNSQIANALAQAGSTGVTLQVQGTSPTSARIVYYSDLGGVPLSWTIAFYAASPNLGAVITQVTVHGINVTTQVISRLTSFGGNSISSIPSGFIVDRVYSCKTLTGDGMMVIEGHR
ncbi:MAG TPA: FecR family protein [Candidatus Dormibacteraeota bacterium]|nr:FecR family protein [Candidatus Dormibacteraeota bacterium]